MKSCLVIKHGFILVSQRVRKYKVWISENNGKPEIARCAHTTKRIKHALFLLFIYFLSDTIPKEAFRNTFFFCFSQGCCFREVALCNKQHSQRYKHSQHKYHNPETSHSTHSPQIVRCFGLNFPVLVNF